MKKGIIILAVIVVVIILIASGKSKQEQTLKIGVVAPLTGGSASYGTGLLKGIQLAQKDLGATKNKYELIVEDDGSEPAKAASAAQKLINIDKVSAIITTTSGTGNSVKPIAAAAGIPHVCICSDTRITDDKFNFTNSVLPQEEAAAWLKHASESGAKKLAILSQNQPGFNLIVDNFKKLAPENGITIVYEERIDPTIKDFKTSISKAKAAKPDLYLIGFFPPQLDILGKEFKDLGLTNMIAGVSTFGATAQPEWFEGRWFSDASLAHPELKDRFVKEYPDIRFNVRVVPFGYDTFNMMVKGLESGEDLSKYLLSLTNYSGESGQISKDAGKSIFHSKVGIWEIKNGTPSAVN